MTHSNSTIVEMDVIRDAPDAYTPPQKPQPQLRLRCKAREREILQLCQPNGLKHLIYGLIPHLAVYATAVYFVLTTSSLWINAALSVILGWELFAIFVVHHDCMHGSAFRSERLNRFFGRLYALTFWMPFSINRQTHLRHHAFIADPERDPDEYYYSGKLWQIWPRVLRYREWYTRIALTRYGKTVRNTVLAEELLTLVVWASVHIVLFRAGMGIKAVFIFWLPVIVAGFVINPLQRGYEHAPITLYPKGDPRRRDMTKNTITIANSLLGWMCANITYHVEHHAYASCPFYNLQKLHRIFQEEKLQYLVAPYPGYRLWKGTRFTETMTCNTPPKSQPPR